MNILFKPFFLLIHVFKTKEWLALTVIFALNIVVKLAIINSSQINLNESIAINAANKSILKSTTNQIGWKVFEPSYKITLCVWSKIVNNSVYGLRCLNALLLSFLALILFRFFNKNVSFRMACWVSLFYFINSSINYSNQNIGSNALILFLSVISSINFLKLYYSPGLKNAVSLGVINCVLFYTSNAYIGLILAQVVVSAFLFKANYKFFALSLGTILIGCNYWLIRYFIKNKIIASQFNIGINLKNLKLFFYANFTDHFFFNVLFAITLIVILNIYIRKLREPVTQQNATIFLYFFISFFLYFIFIFKSKFANYYLPENKSGLFLTLALTVILGFLFGYTKLSSKINLLVFTFVFIAFLPAIKLDRNKNQISYVIVNSVDKTHVRSVDSRLKNVLHKNHSTEVNPFDPFANLCVTII